jgi:glycosyltransferase involved in cell wall biosynthesis
LIKVSAVLIVKNEEDMLPACLESLRDFDEVVILDTGSTDKTPDVMRAYAVSRPGVQARIGEYQWRDHFSEARNKAQETATGDWIFVVDADETIPAGTYEAIQKYVQRLDPNIQVIGFWVESIRGTSRHHSPRLYRNRPEIKWVGSVHNYLSRSEDVQSDMVVKAGYSPTHKKDPDRALRMLEKSVLDEPDSARNWYYLGREYGYKLNWTASERALRKALELSRWSLERADAHLLLSRALWYQRRGPDARLECLKAIGMNPEFKEALVFMGDMSFPAAKKAWHRYAKSATQENLLFARMPHE